MKKKKIALIVFLCAALLGFGATKLILDITSEKGFVTGDRIVGISSGPDFFDNLPGTFYVYFGRGTCPDCIEFEPYLETALSNNSWTVYYFDTAYWKDNARYDAVLAKYHVDYVPSLVKIVNGAYADSIMYNSADESFTQKTLDEFFIPHYTGLLSVTNNKGDVGMPGFPIQFHDKLLCVTFIIMLFNFVFLWIKRRKLNKSALAFIIISSTLSLLMHLMIAGLGWSFAFQFDAGPDPSVFGTIGRVTWLIVTPALYAATVVLCAVMFFKKKNNEPV